MGLVARASHWHGGKGAGRGRAVWSTGVACGCRHAGWSATTPWGQGGGYGRARVLGHPGGTGMYGLRAWAGDVISRRDRPVAQCVGGGVCGGSGGGVGGEDGGGAERERGGV